MAERTGRVVVVTGASAGIGAAAALALARHGDDVVLVGRSQARLTRVAGRIAAATGREPACYRADFGSLAEVRTLGAALASRYPQIDVLANNAGALVGLRHLTPDGFERTMQVNHLAPFLLSHLLLPSLRAAARASGAARVITTSSLAEAAGMVDPENLNGPRLYSRWAVYASTKQANILFTVEAARRWAGDGVVATCFHPGLVRSRFGGASASFTLGKLFMLPPSAGARGLVHLATHPDGVTRPGAFFFWRWETACTPRSRDPDLAAALWDASARAVGVQPADSGHPSIPDAGAVRDIVTDPWFWISTYPAPPEEYDGVGDVDEWPRWANPDDEWFEAALGAVDDEWYDMFAEHGREEPADPDGDDEELVVDLLSVPVYLPGGYVWEIELFNQSWGGDRGVTHYLHGPGIDGRLELARLDPQSRLLVTLRWADVVALAEAVSHDERNRAAGLVGLAPLLFWPLARLTDDHQKDAVRRRILLAWQATGLVIDADAGRLADAAVVEHVRDRDEPRSDPASGVPTPPPARELQAFNRFLEHVHSAASGR